MATYFIGDIHGCYDSLKKILIIIAFNPKTDTLWLTGDLVAKGPHSLQVLHLVYQLKHCVKIILGNHDLSLLEQCSNLNQKPQNNYIQNILQSHNSKKLIYWLRHQPVLQIDENKKIIMTHAGINPLWDIHTTKTYATEIENILRNNNYGIILKKINSNKHHIKSIPHLTNKDLKRIQFNINSFTKMRYLLPNGQLDMCYKDSPKQAPHSLKAWFNIPRLIPSNYNIIFGHWSSLEGQGTPQGIYGLDSGCYRGGKLTVLQWENKKIIQIPCNHHYSS